APGVPADHFAIRWRAYISPPTDGQYTFITRSDDGVKLYLDDKLIINDWNAHTVKENRATIRLQKDKRYKIVCEFFDDGALAEIHLLWQGPQQPLAPIQPISTGGYDLHKVESRLTRLLTSIQTSLNNLQHTIIDQRKQSLRHPLTFTRVADPLYQLHQNIVTRLSNTADSEHNASSPKKEHLSPLIRKRFQFFPQLHGMLLQITNALINAQTKVPHNDPVLLDDLHLLAKVYDEIPPQLTSSQDLKKNAIIWQVLPAAHRCFILRSLSSQFAYELEQFSSHSLLSSSTTLKGGKRRYPPPILPALENALRALEYLTLLKQSIQDLSIPEAGNLKKNFQAFLSVAEPLLQKYVRQTYASTHKHREKPLKPSQITLRIQEKLRQFSALCESLADSYRKKLRNILQPPDRKLAQTIQKMRELLSRLDSLNAQKNIQPAEWNDITLQTRNISTQLAQLMQTLQMLADQKNLTDPTQAEEARDLDDMIGTIQHRLQELLAALPTASTNPATQSQKLAGSLRDTLHNLSQFQPILADPGAISQQQRRQLRQLEKQIDALSQLDQYYSSINQLVNAIHANDIDTREKVLQQLLQDDPAMRRAYIQATLGQLKKLSNTLQYTTTQQRAIEKRLDTIIPDDLLRLLAQHSQQLRNLKQKNLDPIASPPASRHLLDEARKNIDQTLKTLENPTFPFPDSTVKRLANYLRQAAAKLKLARRGKIPQNHANILQQTEQQ
ncbi:MAG: hypothetical protein D6820_05815, partial [Lentisphaerae bacterium]